MYNNKVRKKKKKKNYPYIMQVVIPLIIDKMTAVNNKLDINFFYLIYILFFTFFS